MQTRYTILTGTDWRGDPNYHLYDNALGITVALFSRRADAQAEMATRLKEDSENAS